MPLSSPQRSASTPEQALDRLLAWLARLATLISGCCLVVLIAIFGWLVFGRYVLNATPTWAEQLGLLLIVVISFLSAAVGVHEQRHLSVDFFRDALPPRGRIALLVTGDLIMAGFGLLMALHAWHLVVFKWSTEIPLLGLPEGLRSLPLSVCGVLLVLFAGTRAIRRALGRFPAEDARADTEDEAAPLEAPDLADTVQRRG